MSVVIFDVKSRWMRWKECSTNGEEEKCTLDFHWKTSRLEAA